MQLVKSMTGQSIVLVVAGCCVCSAVFWRRACFASRCMHCRWFSVEQTMAAACAADNLVYPLKC
jgi:hypothetical protein